MKALHCLAEAFTWLFRPGIRRYILLPLVVNIILFTAGSYAAWHYSTTLIDRLLPDWLAWLDWLLYPLIGLTLLILTYATFALMANLIAAPFNSLLAAAVEKAERGEPEPPAHDLCGATSSRASYKKSTKRCTSSPSPSPPSSSPSSCPHWHPYSGLPTPPGAPHCNTLTTRWRTTASPSANSAAACDNNAATALPTAAESAS